MTQYQTIKLPTGEVITGAFDTLGWFNEIKKYVDFSGKDVVDYGCAEGTMTFLASEQNARKVTGIDSNTERIAAAINHYQTESDLINFINSTVQDQPTAAQIGIFSMILHWLPDPQKTLRILLSLIDETAIIIFRKSNGGYTSENGNWFPTTEELIAYMEGCSFTCIHTHLLQTQDNGKEICLAIFERFKNVFFTTDGRYVVKIIRPYPRWENRISILAHIFNLPLLTTWRGGYIMRRIQGTRLSEIPVVDLPKFSKFIEKLERGFKESGLMFTDLAPGNILYDGKEFHIIDFDEIGRWDESNTNWLALRSLI